jgi:NAD(P)-dependent dehydrogenase (short-subunit alcohol dehydrogenase family)
MSNAGRRRRLRGAGRRAGTGRGQRAGSLRRVLDAATATALLRPGLLEGRRVALAGGADAAGAACAALGATIGVLAVDPADEEGARAAAEGLGRVDVLVCDARPAWTAAGGGEAGLRAGADAAFLAVRAVALAGWIPDGGAATGPGAKAVLIAPAPGAGPHAGGLRAALENLARTLSTEWARFGVTLSALLPGDATDEGDVAALCAFLASEAGDYVAGTAFTLGGSSPARP